jgi:hypothetical protein
MYGVSGEKATGRSKIGRFFANFADPTKLPIRVLISHVMLLLVSTKFHYFKIVPPASPYIIIPPGGIIIYELAGGNILKKRNVVDPTIVEV